jgi:hypothetical protein
METALMRYGRVMENGGMVSRLSCRCLTKCKSCNNISSQALHTIRFVAPLKVSNLATSCRQLQHPQQTKKNHTPLSIRHHPHRNAVPANAIVSI